MPVTHFPSNTIAALGRYAILWTNHFLRLLAFLARVIATLPGSLTGDNRLRWSDVSAEVDAMGVHSLALVFMASVTIAISSVVLSLEQLSVFGGLSLVSFFTIKIILREAAPLIVGIVLTVKAGSYVAMRIGRNAQSESGEIPERLQTDRAMLLMPSVLAMFIVGPALYLVSVVLSLLAGVISQSFGSVDNFHVFFESFLQFMLPSDLAFGLVKTLVFGFTIVFINGYFGFETAPGAESAGKTVLTGIVVSYSAILTINVLSVYGYSISQLIPDF